MNKTFYKVQVVGRDGRYETKLNTASKSQAKREMKKQKQLGWSGRVITEATEKEIAKW
jgi:hypothetical protein